MGRTVATLVTMTTYGTWLRGDRRGWVGDGITFPADPVLEAADRVRLKYAPYFFDPARLLDVGGFLGASLITRLAVELYALTVQTWHVHFVIGPTTVGIADVVKCAKDAARYGLRPGRPIWSDGYDKRFCFERMIAVTRIRYVEKHNLERGWPRRPWEFLRPPAWVDDP